jgi:N-acetyl-anhydromuramyl-L-alanine amidase AmpD
MGYELVGRVWDASSFDSYVQTLDLSWVKGVTLHHTGAPNLAQRPHGLKAQHIRNIADYYKSKLGWSSGPHLFVDEDQIWGMSSLERRGVHAKSFNRTHIGIEVLGNYDSEDPSTGRGLACWAMTSQAVASILKATRLPTSAVNGHRDDPRTSKSCPGKRVDLDQFRALLNLNPSQEDDRTPDDNELEDIVEALEWQLKKLRKLT